MKNRAVITVLTATAGDIDDAGRVAELGLEEIALNFEFLHHIERRSDGAIADPRVAHFHAIE